jgi:hypothetical protein
MFSDVLISGYRVFLENVIPIAQLVKKKVFDFVQPDSSLRYSQHPTIDTYTFLALKSYFY